MKRRPPKKNESSNTSPPRERSKHSDGRKSSRNERAPQAEDWSPYGFPIIDILSRADGPLSFDALAQALDVTDQENLATLRKQLSTLANSGGLLLNRRNRYALVDHTDLVIGRVIGRNDGRGRVVAINPKETTSADIFLSPREMRRVLPDDRVLIRVSRVDHRGQSEGHVVALLESLQTSVVGHFAVEEGVCFVVPDDKRFGKDVIVAKQDANNAQPGDMVVAELKRHPLADGLCTGRISEILGDHMAPGMEIEIAIRKHNLPHVWPTQVEGSASRFSDRVDPKDCGDRYDLRDLPLVTIDGADARDFDDAVFAEPISDDEESGWRLIVAIADVAHYVKQGAALDKEAALRGNSVYFPRRVLPMLPEVLSNGLCSLNPNVDRLCMVCDMRFNTRGELVDYEFYEGVMRSHARLTYNQVAEFLEKGKKAPLPAKSVAPALRNLHQLFKLMLKNRIRRGALDLDLPEAVVLLDEKERKIETIQARTRNDAHRLIEECMLAANVCAAELVSELEEGCIYRVHETPDRDKLSDLRRLLSQFGLKLDGGDEPQAADFSRLITAARQRDDVASFIQMMVLRTMQQARYSTSDLGHFALGYDSYSHFTSPIRRYADLVTHRQIKQIIHGNESSDGKSGQRLDEIADQCSLTDRRAEIASRDVLSWLKAEFMLDKIGNVYRGTITGVTSFGAFVQLDDIFVEGLVHISELGNDYYHFDPVRYQLQGERSGQIYRPGTPLEVKVTRVDLDAGKIDFLPTALLQEKSKKGGGGDKGRSKPGRKKRGRKSHRGETTVDESTDKSPGKKPADDKATGKSGKKKGKKGKKGKRNKTKSEPTGRSRRRG